MSFLFKNKQQLYEVYCNPVDTDKFLAGFVCASNDEYVLMEGLDAYGDPDGIICIIKEDILRVQTDSKYLKKLKKLFDYKGHQRKDLEFNETGNFVKDILMYARKNNKICSIELCESQTQDVFGYVSKINEKNNSVQVEVVDIYGDKDGQTEIDIAKITSIECESTQTTLLEILSNLK